MSLDGGLQKLIEESNGGLEGWATVEKALAMAELIVETKPSVVVELGVFGGRSLIPQAMAVRHNGYGVVVGVDPWKLEPVLEGDLAPADKEWWTNNVNLHDIHNGFVDALWRHKLDSVVVVMRTTSQLAASLLRGIDIAHVDGNHTELASCRDVEVYLLRVRPGGYVWFDDTDWPTTQKAVGMLESACEKVRMVGTCALYRKKGGKR